MLILVDAADDDGGAVGAQQRRHPLEALLTVLEVDRVDDGLALAEAQRQLEDGGVGGVDHQRHFHAPGELAHEAVHVGRLVAVGVGQAHVEHLGGGTDLGAADFGGVVEAVGDDQLLELPRADDVGPLAHEYRTVVVGRIEDLDAAHGLGLDRRGHARRLAGHEARDRADVLRRGATAAAHEVDPALVHEARELEGETLRRLAVLAALVGQPRVGIHARPARGDRGQRAEVVGHELGPGRAVEPDREEPEVLERDVERLDALTREHGAHGLDGRRDHQRHVESARRALRAPHPERGGLEVERVLRRLQ